MPKLAWSHGLNRQWGNSATFRCLRIETEVNIIDPRLALTRRQTRSGRDAATAIATMPPNDSPRM